MYNILYIIFTDCVIVYTIIIIGVIQTHFLFVFRFYIFVFFFFIIIIIQHAARRIYTIHE